MVSPAFWFGLCVTIVMAVLPDILGTIISRQFAPTNIEKAQEEDMPRSKSSKKFTFQLSCGGETDMDPIISNRQSELRENLLEPTLYFRS